MRKAMMSLPLVGIAIGVVGAPAEEPGDLPLLPQRIHENPIQEKGTPQKIAMA
jgi:hypothetical protein